MGGIFGLALIIYGSYVWKKVTHVVWTKQAIREMMDKEFRAEEDFRQRYASTSNLQKVSSKSCPSCGSVLDEEDVFCTDCGAKLVNEGSCPGCGASVGNDDVFCPECGTKVTNESDKIVCLNCQFESEKGFGYCQECGQRLTEGT